ncbi:MAG: hypothetical protein AAB698_01665 [Patescibacteria group bacterium]
MIGFNIGDIGDITLEFEGGTKLKFTSWNAFDDVPNYDGVEIKTKE